MKDGGGFAVSGEGTLDRSEGTAVQPYASMTSMDGSFGMVLACCVQFRFAIARYRMCVIYPSEDDSGVSLCDDFSVKMESGSLAW